MSGGYKPSQDRWEYKIWSPPVEAAHSRDLFILELNRLGEEGWEVVTRLHPDLSHMLFKRRLVSEDL